MILKRSVQRGVRQPKEGNIRMSSFSSGFTLVEMLVVIGILAILISVGLSSKKAQKAKGQELVHNVAAALEKIYQEEGAWPRRILSGNNSENGLDENISYTLAKRGALTLSYDDSKKKTTALDQCGVVSP